jgi:hypothetical protein
MPSRPTVYGWVLDNEDGFSSKYARAREIQAHSLADDQVEIADNGSNDWMERNDPENPGWLANGEHLQRSRLRFDARKWAASKILPKVYGDKVTQEHTGADGGPIQLQAIDRPPNETREQWIARRRAELDHTGLLLGTAAGTGD